MRSKILGFGIFVFVVFGVASMAQASSFNNGVLIAQNKCAPGKCGAGKCGGGTKADDNTTKAKDNMKDKKGKCGKGK